MFITAVAVSSLRAIVCVKQMRPGLCPGLRLAALRAVPSRAAIWSIQLCCMPDKSGLKPQVLRPASPQEPVPQRIQARRVSDCVRPNLRQSPINSSAMPAETRALRVVLCSFRRLGPGASSVGRVGPVLLGTSLAFLMLDYNGSTAPRYCKVC